MAAKPRTAKASLREHLPLVPQHEARFRWRGTGVTRVEGFTDSVFAFAVTLLVVALEVPHTYDGLLDIMRRFPAFVICFALLMSFWNAHYRYHRRYGLEDVPTRLLTLAIIVLVLFFVYPLKFLFTLITVQLFGLDLHNAPQLESLEQLRMLYILYGAGLAGIWGLYAVLYVYALRLSKKLQLDTAEILYTKTSLVENLIYVGVCLLSIVLAISTSSDWLPGFIYFLLGPLQTLNGWWFGRRIRALPAA